MVVGEEFREWFFVTGYISSQGVSAGVTINILVLSESLDSSQRRRVSICTKGTYHHIPGAKFPRQCE